MDRDFFNRSPRLPARTEYLNAPVFANVTVDLEIVSVASFRLLIKKIFFPLLSRRCSLKPLVVS